MSHLFLVGFMGAGKSTVGAQVARALNLRLLDIDARIEEHAGMTVGELFETQGEEAFRDLESAELEALADEPPSVVACGGGIVLRDANRRRMKELGRVIYLRVTAGEALARVGDLATRPLLARGGPGAAQALLAARESLYVAVADASVDTVGRTPEAVADGVLDALAALEVRQTLPESS